MGLLLLLIVSCWSGLGGRLASSNDGSHLALARALVVFGRTSIDRDVALTLGVDRARRDGHWYSDRPPGTAWLALPAVWVGSRLDPVLWDLTVKRKRAVVLPARRNYISTYVARSPEAPPLAGYQGTALAITLHAMVVGLLGLLAVDRLLVRRGVQWMERGLVMGILGLASLWGPYATMLFSHASAGLMLAAMVLALDGEGVGPRRALTAGVAGAMAVACDYALALAVVPIALVLARPRMWPWVALGAAPVAVALAAYHHVAFGSVFAIGYDFQSNFEFARERESTFSGDPLQGLWVLWGLGKGAGMLAQAPVMLAGALALAIRRRRIALALAPWLVVLLFHRTPWGGATMDHRYLVPALPLFAVGLGDGLAAMRNAYRPRWMLVLLVVLAVISSLRVWTHLFAWRG